VSQVGGEHATVTSIIVNPDTDPHDYEATPSDAKTIAQAQFVILNGVGYDPWVQKLVDANPVPGRKVLVVGDLFGKKDGDNPHLWYSPDYVGQFIDRVGSDLGALDPAHSGYFADQAQRYKTVGLKAYSDTVATIKHKYAGTKVGATESIFSYLAEATGLDLVTPYSYLKSVSEGQDPSAADKAEAENQITSKEIKVFVFNSQNSTPDIQGLVARAHAAGIPVVAITETLSPENATFQDWQTRQLGALLAALGG
jgi:zinc/manganese transport system substrate-binding protein